MPMVLAAMWIIHLIDVLMSSFLIDEFLHLENKNILDNPQIKVGFFPQTSVSSGGTNYIVWYKLMWCIQKKFLRFSVLTGLQG